MTELKRSTEATVILAAPDDAIIGLTTLGVIESWNPAAVRLYGYEAEEIIGRDAQVLVPPEHRVEEAATFRRVVDGESAPQYQAARIDKDGSRLTVWVTTSVILDNSQAVVAVVRASRRVGYASDVADQYELDRHRRLIDAERDLVQAQFVQSERMEVLGRLAGGVAHDFNNLLGVILNYAAFVSEELTAATACPPDYAERCQGAQRDVAQIQRAAERATDLTHQLLAFARREVVQPQVLNLNDKVNGVEELLRRTLAADMELFINLPDDAVVDPRRPRPDRADPG